MRTSTPKATQSLAIPVGRALAAECRAAAKAEGISARDLDEVARDMIGGGDNLVDLLANALESATDDEIRRLVAKND